MAEIFRHEAFFKSSFFKFMGFSAEMLNDSECIHGDLQVPRYRAPPRPACEANSCSTKRRALAQDKVSEESFTSDLRGRLSASNLYQRLLPS